MTRNHHLVLSFTALAAGLLTGCPTSRVDAPAEFSGPLKPTAVYGVDASGTAGGISTIPEQLLWAADGRPTSPKPAVNFTRFRVEFNQPVNGATVAQDENLISGTTGLSNVASFSYCSPVSNGGTNSVAFADVDDATTPNRPLPASTCYDPGSKVGSTPSILIVPGAGTLLNTAGAAPLTCQNFTAAPATEVLLVNHKYSIKLAGIKSTNNQGLEVPSGNGWSGDANSATYTFTTDDFEVLGAGYQNQVTGFFSWAEKLPGFHYFAPVTPLEQQIDCDFTSADSSQKPCRIPPDDTTFQVLFTTKIDTTTIPANVSIVRKGTTDDTAVGFGTARSSRTLLFGPALRWEPNAEYTITIKSGLKSTSGKTLGTDKVYNLKVGSGLSAGNTKLIQLLTISPDNGSSTNPIDTAAVALQFSYPVDISGATFSIKDPTGKEVAGAASLASDLGDQEVDVAITETLLPATTYTVKITGLKVEAVAGLPAGTAGTAFDPINSTFRTTEFNATHLVDKVSGGNTYDSDLGNTIPPSYLVPGSGKLNIQFDVAPDAAKTIAGVKLKENGVEVAGTTVSATTDPTIFKIDPPAGFKPKYGASYSVTVPGTGGTGGAITSADGKYTLRAENCATGDCSQALAFRTSTFNASIAVTDRTKGTFTVSLSGPIDLTQVNEFLNGAPNKMFIIYPQTLTIDPNTGAHILTTNTAAPIYPVCTANATGSVFTCKTDTVLAANKPYLAVATFYAAKVAGAGGPAISTSTTLDTNTARFFGTVSRTFLPTCAP